MNKPFIILFTLGSVMLMAFSIYKTVQAEAAIENFRNAFPVQPSSFARPISATIASDCFGNYHQSSNTAGSKGVLRNEGEAIVQFYIDQEQLIEPLRLKAIALGKEFLGLSAIPAYNDSLRTHTLIWVAVVDADTSANVVPELMLPQSGEVWQDYIYDHINSCPSYCPENSNWLWNKNWAE